MSKFRKTITYIVFDYFSAFLAWFSFYYYRKIKFGSLDDIFTDPKLYFGVTLIPLFWLVLYYASGSYNNVTRKSRLTELGQTFFSSFIGVIIIFFLLILDDTIHSYKNYYSSFLVLFSIQFLFTYIPRIIITSLTIKKIRQGLINWNCLVIGSNGKAIDTIKEVQSLKRSSGENVVGFASLDGKFKKELESYAPYLGKVEDLKQIIEENKIEDVIIALENNEHNKLGNIINSLGINDVTIKIIPDLFDILTGSVKLNNLYGTPFIQVSWDVMPEWQKISKQFIDITASLFALIITLPLTLSLALLIKLTSKGPVFYSHQRIGKAGKPFNILKFRSMYTDAENNGPRLSSKNDDRITKIGRFMRKYRLDEIPNFINVLKGDMSLVGPRPEREYYINKIIKKAPQYSYLHSIKPGITSLGQVKYGYAESVEEMIMRMRYDLIYLENRSLFMDLKIVVYTINTIFRGRGV